MRSCTALFALLLAVSVAAQTPAGPQFQVTLNDVDSSKLPALHSFAGAQGSSGKWLLVGGRTNGLHLFVSSSNGGTTPPPNAFPTTNANQNFWVIDPVARQAWSAPVTTLPQPISDALSATNAQSYSDGKTLYVLGGYGWSTKFSQMITFPTLTAIDVDNTINAIVAGTSVAPYIQQTSTFYDCPTAGTNAYNACAAPFNACSGGGAGSQGCPCAGGAGFADCVKAGFAACETKRAAATGDCGKSFRAGSVTGLPTNTNGFYTGITGGGLEHIGDTYYLVFGQSFQGLYSLSEGDYGKWPVNQIYPQRIVAMAINPSPLAAAVLTQLQQDPSDQTSQYHRRDLNVVPAVDTNGSLLIEALGGVFVPGQDAAYQQPILISQPSSGGISASLQPYQQAMSQYECAVVPLVNRGAATSAMTNLMLGGISLYYVDDKTGKLKVDSGLPFISAISALTRAGDGSWSEFYRVAPITIGGSPARVGADAKFFRQPTVGASPNGVIYLDAIKQKTLVGWMFGGILATAPNPGASNSGTSATPQLFEVWIDPTPPPSGYWASTAAAAKVIITPNADTAKKK
jgi:hypothetical protein